MCDRGFLNLNKYAEIVRWLNTIGYRQQQGTILCWYKCCDAISISIYGFHSLSKLSLILHGLVAGNSVCSFVTILLQLVIL